MGISAIFAINMTYSQFIKQVCKELLRLYPEKEAAAIAIRLLQHFCGISSYEHLVEPNGLIAPEIEPALKKAVSQLAQARPLQYVVGCQEFCGLKIAVEEGILIPRPETEELVMWVAEYVQKENSFKILDAACGSGAIACAIASKFSLAQIFACDISEKAIDITTKNLSSCGFNNAQVFKCNLLNNATQIVRQNIDAVDIIVSNPPYVTEQEKKQMRPNVLKFEPAEALFVPDTNPLLFYSALRDLAIDLLLPGGAIFMEINEQFASETSALFSREHFSSVEIRKDIFDKPRMVLAVRNS